MQVCSVSMIVSAQGNNRYSVEYFIFLAKINGNVHMYGILWASLLYATDARIFYQ